MTKEEKKQSKNFESAISFINELKMDIAYNKDCISNGFYKSQIGKNKIGGKLEYLEGMLLAITKELNK